MKQDQKVWDYQTYARLYKQDPKRAEEYRNDILGKKEKDIDERIEEIKAIVADPASELEKVYEEGTKEIEEIKQEASEEEKKTEIRRLLKEKGIKFSNFSKLDKLIELAKENGLLE